MTNNTLVHTIHEKVDHLTGVKDNLQQLLDASQEEFLQTGKNLVIVQQMLVTTQQMLSMQILATAQQMLAAIQESLAKAQQQLAMTAQEFNDVKHELDDVKAQYKDLVSLSIPGKTLNKIPDLSDLPDFYSTWSLWQKIMYFIKEENKGQTGSEILSKILVAEPLVAANEELKKKLTVNLFATLNNKYKLREIQREKVGGEFVYWFLPE